MENKYKVCGPDGEHEFETENECLEYIIDDGCDPEIGISNDVIDGKYEVYLDGKLVFKSGYNETDFIKNHRCPYNAEMEYCDDTDPRCDEIKVCEHCNPWTHRDHDSIGEVVLVSVEEK